MNATGRPSWVRPVILSGVAYFVVGIVFAGLAGASVSHQARILWRLAAWVAAGAVYVTHVAYEHSRLGNPPRPAALHIALAVAVGAFALAGHAIIHSLSTGSAPGHFLPLALVIWPVITALPAFVVALVAGTLLARLPRRA